MKYKIIIAVLLVFFTGCQSSFDQEKCLNEIQNAFPESEVISLNMLDEKTCCLLVKMPNQKIKYVEIQQLREELIQ